MPIHPLIVHFPVASYVLMMICIWISLFRNDSYWPASIKILTIAGLAGSGLAILTGNLDHEPYEAVEALHEMVEDHELFAYIFTWFFGMIGVWIFLRINKMTKFEHWGLAIAASAGTILLWLTAHEGGELVYSFVDL